MSAANRSVSQPAYCPCRNTTPPVSVDADRVLNLLEKARATGMIGSSEDAPRSFFGPGASAIIRTESCSVERAAQVAEIIRARGVEDWFIWRDRLRQEMILTQTPSRQKFLQEALEPDASATLLIAAFEYGISRYGDRILDCIAEQLATLEHSAQLWRLHPHMVSGCVLEQAFADLVRALRADYDIQTTR